MDEDTPLIFEFLNFGSELEIQKITKNSAQCVNEDLGNCYSTLDRSKFVDAM